jgi:hypothetical protein
MLSVPGLTNSRCRIRMQGFCHERNERDSMAPTGGREFSAARIDSKRYQLNEMLFFWLGKRAQEMAHIFVYVIHTFQWDLIA